MICRLCLKDAKEVMQIFAEHGANLNAAIIVGTHFWFEPKKDDPISTAVCRLCWENVYNFHVFYLAVEEAHRLLAERFTVKTAARGSIKTKESEDTEVQEELAAAVEEKESECVNSVVYEYVSSDGSEDGREVHSTVNTMVAKGAENIESSAKLELEECIQAESAPDGDNIYENDMMDVEVIEFVDETVVHENKKPLQKISSEESAPHKMETRRSKRSCVQKSLESTKKQVEPPAVEETIRDDHISSDPSEVKEDCPTPPKKRGRPRKDAAHSSLQLPKTPKEKKNNSVAHVNEIDAKIASVVHLSCYVCNDVFETYTILKNHIRGVHLSKPYAMCCNKKFNKRALLVEHIEKHLNPDIYKCDDCNKTFADKQCLRNHILIKHQPDEMKPYECPHCDKKFAKSYLLEQHRAYHAERTHACTECERLFPSKNALNSHVKLKHKNYGQICEICAKIIPGRAAFERHQLMHKGVPQPKVQCDICGSWHTDKHSLHKHKRRHGESSATCNLCGKVAPNRGALRSHERYVHTDRNFKCSECNKTFKKAINLREHMALHTGEVLYKCPHCPKTFNSNANMHSHRKKLHPVEFEETRRTRAENASKPVLLQENKELSPEPTETEVLVIQSDLPYESLPDVITIENHSYLVSTEEDFNEDSITITIKDP